MEVNFKKRAGQQLQMLRLEKNLTQEQMSEKLHLSTSAYCKIEYGETDLTLTRLNKIAEVLDISALELFSRIDKSTNNGNPKGNNSTKISKENNNGIEPYGDLRGLIKANSQIIELLCKRIDLLERHIR